MFLRRPASAKKATQRCTGLADSFRNENARLSTHLTSDTPRERAFCIIANARLTNCRSKLPQSGDAVHFTISASGQSLHLSALGVIREGFSRLLPAEIIRSHGPQSTQNLCKGEHGDPLRPSHNRKSDLILTIRTLGDVSVERYPSPTLRNPRSLIRRGPNRFRSRTPFFEACTSVSLFIPPKSNGRSPSCAS